MNNKSIDGQGKLLAGGWDVIVNCLLHMGGEGPDRLHLPLTIHGIRCTKVVYLSAQGWVSTEVRGKIHAER